MPGSGTPARVRRATTSVLVCPHVARCGLSIVSALGIDAVAVRRREKAAFDLLLAEGASGDLDVVDEPAVLRRIRRILTRADAEVVHGRQRVADLAARRSRVREPAVLVEPDLGSVVGQRDVCIDLVLNVNIGVDPAPARIRVRD